MSQCQRRRTTQTALRNREKMKQRKRITLSMIDAVGAGERLIGVAFRLLLASHRVQLVALT